MRVRAARDRGRRPGDVANQQAAVVALWLAGPVSLVGELELSGVRRRQYRLESARIDQAGGAGPGETAAGDCRVIQNISAKPRSELHNPTDKRDVCSLGGFAL